MQEVDENNETIISNMTYKKDNWTEAIPDMTYEKENDTDDIIQTKQEEVKAT